MELRLKSGSDGVSYIRILQANNRLPKGAEKSAACTGVGTYRILNLKPESHSVYLRTPLYVNSPQSNRGNAQYQDVLLVRLPANSLSRPMQAAPGTSKRWSTYLYANRHQTQKVRAQNTYIWAQEQPQGGQPGGRGPARGRAGAGLMAGDRGTRRAAGAGRRGSVWVPGLVAC